ncbi:EthD family reductase [uncultured Bosea sp.]|uniref:EthD family reductase n=1 Tax=uncultured Bosea sp. TaxID=211457 RepID=UPI0025EE9734|nr:EthD family reductase [uncultured Bosea sp.]
MIIRTAVLEGEVPVADKAHFDREMTETVLPAIRRYPGIRDVKLRWQAEQEAGAPPVYLTFDLYFDSLEAMHAALASNIRQEVRRELGTIMPLFKGRVYHLILRQDD